MLMISKIFYSVAEKKNFFFEFKADQETPSKLVKEISAFANTYGGYLFLGVNDDKTISGCLEWNEQRIHSTIHDSISPTPIFDVKKFEIDRKVIYIIKIEEGKSPPYVTNKGQIFERLSSGSFPIKESSQLNLLHKKKADMLSRLKSKIELPALIINQDFPQNIRILLINDRDSFNVDLFSASVPMFSYSEIYALLDKRTFDELGEEYNYNNLIDCLFYCAYIDMGYIDPLKTEGAE